jgi:nucleotide-binding universal stress UspA family protein
VFRRILVAMDGSEAARSAFVFVSDWARHFGAEVWFIQLTAESTRRRCEVVTDVRRRGRQLANEFSVSGATRSARNHQLVSAIVEAAQTFRADLIVLGFDRSRLAPSRLSSSVREQVTEAADVPVLIAPKRTRARRPPAQRPRRAIPLGPAPSAVEVPEDERSLAGV